MIELQPFAALLASYSRRQQRDLEAKRTQQRRKCSVEFVAKTSPPQVHYLVKSDTVVDHNLAPQSDIQVFKRNRQHMCPVDRAKSAAGRFSGTGISNTTEIGGYVQHDQMITDS